MKTEIREVTPMVAAEMLKNNNNNRRLSEKHVNFLSQEMNNGNWLFDGQPLRFDGFGRILDGQHRLNAVIKSKTCQKFLIVSGLTQETFKVMDTGKIRNAADAFSILGAQYSTDLSSVSRFILSFKIGEGSHTKTKISNTDLLNWYEQNPIINEMIITASNLNTESGKFITRSTICSFLYLFSERHQEQAKDFIYKLCTGLGVELKSPIYALRKKLISDKMNTLKMPPRYKNAIIIKAWNLCRKNKTAVYLKFSETEKFPTIL